jgi:uncharacterized Zn-binding protein involved in type VI secretion
MAFPQARIGDVHMCATPIPFSSPILPPGTPTVLVENMPAARMGPELVVSGVAPPAVPTPVPHNFIKGSATVLITNMPALRVLDPCAMGGMVSNGAMTVITGG